MQARGAAGQILVPRRVQWRAGSAKCPGPQHRHSGNRIARYYAQDQTEGNGLYRDAEHSLSFLDVKKATYARVGVIALEKAKNNGGIYERANEKLLRT